MVRRTLRLMGAAALLAAPAGLRAQDRTLCTTPEDVEVTKLSVDGNVRYDDAFVKNGIKSEGSSRWRTILHLPFGRKRCYAADTLGYDVERLLFHYRTSGFPFVQVDTVITHTGRKVAISINIREGVPTIIGALRLNGLDNVAERDNITRKLPLAVGDRFDEFRFDAAVDSLTRRLFDAGYPSADVLRAWTVDSAKATATIDLNVTAGTRARFGTIDVHVTPRAGAAQKIDSTTVLRIAGVSTGGLYRESKLQRAKRNLISLDTYSSVAVIIDKADIEPPGDSLVDVKIELTETNMHSVRPGGGWGTLDCFRAQSDYHDNNFLNGARRFDARLSLSKIGIGRPLSGAAPLCPHLRNDPYSSKLNYYLGGTLTEPTTSLFGMRPSITVFSERRSEYQAFLRTIPIGVQVNATRSSTSRTTQTIGYRAEYRRTEAQPAVFCALYNLCLPEDREPLLKSRWLATASWAMARDWSDDPQYPSRGGGAQFELRHASHVIGSDGQLEFTKVTADAHLFFLLGKNTVLAPRLRLGLVAGPGGKFGSGQIPQEERLYAGGGQTVRGFKPNELGPKVYIARGFDTVQVTGTTGAITPTDTVYFRANAALSAERSVPTGGNALIVANLELRRRISDLFQATAFLDAGELWSPGARQVEDRFDKLKLTPGVGVRVITFIGAIGIDIAFNPYAARAGAAYFDTPIQLGGQLYCVSPGNALAVTGLGVAGRQPVQASGACAADFRPPSSNGFFSRLNFSFAIGQAY